jgi:hypothetical protein
MRTIKKRRARQSYSTQHFKPSPEQTPRRAYPRANILAVGTADFPRYVIIDDGKAASEDRKYWAGAKWIEQPHLAALFAHQKFAWEEVRRLRGAQAHR